MRHHQAVHTMSYCRGEFGETNIPPRFVQRSIGYDNDDRRKVYVIAACDRALEILKEGKK